VQFLLRLLHPIYRVDRRSSASQLALDFEEFPPSPLLCAELEGSWNLVRVRGIGRSYQDLKVLRALARAVEQEESVIDREISSNEQFLFMRQNFEKAKQQFPRLMRAVVWLLPVVVAIRPWFSRSEAVLITRDGSEGYFNALSPDDIVVKAAAKNVMSEAAIASHEHIHLLQHRDGENHNRFLRSPSSLLSDKALEIPQIQYFFEKKEVEARLHEYVLSFYRSHGHLPITVTGFLSLLGSSRNLAWFINDTLEIKAVGVDSSFALYSVRELEMAEQLESMLLSLRTPQLERRFIKEVLTVMYGNLLRYYGDRTASDEFLGQIERPNLYDQIYAPILHDSQCNY